MRAGTIGRRTLAAAALAIAIAIIAPASASATFPGTNGLVAFGAATSAVTAGDIYVVNPDGSGLKAITNAPEDEYTPSFSADGERIVFVRTPRNTPQAIGEIWVMNADGSGQTRLLSGTTAMDVTNPSFSPDGGTIVYEAVTNATGTANVWAMNADGSGAHALTSVASVEDAGEPVFSPDGSKIAFTYNSAGFRRIALMNPDGSGLVGISAPTPAGQGSPDWSPDGTKIVYRESRSIAQMDAPSGLNIVPLTNSAGPPYDSSPVFSPQGTQFAFNRQGVSSTGEVRLGTAGANLGPTTVLAPSSGGAGAGGSLSWQPLNPPSCDVGGSASAKSGKSVTVTLSCSNENAAVSITGTGKAPKPKKKGGKGKGKAVPFTITPIASEIPAAGSTDVIVPLPKKPAKAVKKGKKAKATLEITFTDGLGATTTSSADVVFKAKKKKGKGGK